MAAYFPIRYLSLSVNLQFIRFLVLFRIEAATAPRVVSSNVGKFEIWFSKEKFEAFFRRSLTTLSLRFLHFNFHHYLLEPSQPIKGYKKIREYDTLKVLNFAGIKFRDFREF